ncbi:hypothetical protein J6590_049393 [Homalodisca vitripennis]|nr:hypothetical protein J6590_049393 [Homalodisca vitripennis]
MLPTKPRSHCFLESYNIHVTPELSQPGCHMEPFYGSVPNKFRRVTGQSHQSRHSQKIYSIMDVLLRYLHLSGSVPAQVRQSLCRRPSVIFIFLPTDIFGLFGRLTVA